MSKDEQEKWDRRHAERGFFPLEPSALVSGCADRLPVTGGRALDLAGGSGRHAIWLAERGFDVTLADISQAALRIAGLEAETRGIRLTTHSTDLEGDPFPAGPWDVLLCVHYLQRSLYREFARQLSKDGVLIHVQPTRRNLERHDRPGERYLLAEGELRELAISNALDILHYQEEWTVEGRHEALLVAGAGKDEAPLTRQWAGTMVQA